MIRPSGALIAAALVVSSVAGASAASAATPSTGAASLAHAASTARAEAGAALGGLTLPAGTRAQSRTAAAAKASTAESIDDTVQVAVKDERYDIHAVSIGARTDPTRIRLFVGGTSAQIAVRSFVQVTVRRHGAKTDVLRVTTSFRRFVVMETALESDPLASSLKRFGGPSALTATLTRSLALSRADTVRQYGAVLRFAQMSLDLSTTLLDALTAVQDDPSLTDFSGVAATHTTAGSGGYAGSVTLSGTPSRISVSAVNSTDGSTLTGVVTDSSLTFTYTIDGTTYTQRIPL